LNAALPKRKLLEPRRMVLSTSKKAASMSFFGVDGILQV